MARELGASISELDGIRPSRDEDRAQYWNERALAPGVLSEGVAVERWALAEYLLGRWLEWDSWVDRWRRYFSRSEEELPQKWTLLRRRWAEKRGRFLDDETLIGTIVERRGADEMRDVEAVAPIQHRPDSARGLFHLIVAEDRLHRLRQRSWQFDSREVAALEHRIVSLSLGEQRALVRILRTYCRSMALVSWLDDGLLTGVARRTWEITTVDHHRWIEDVIESVCGESSGSKGLFEGDSAARVRRILERIEAAISELGYDRFFADIQSDDFRPGPDSVLGDQNINVIPTDQTGACCPILVALSKGGSGRGALSFDKIMRRVKTHLIDCTGITKTVIFLCDTWDSREFAENHFEELAAHHRRGVRFAFLQIGAPRTVMAPVAIDLAQPPL